MPAIVNRNRAGSRLLPPSATWALAVLLSLGWPGASDAFVHLSLFHPVSTNPDPHASANLAVSVFQSRIGTLNGLGLHPVVSQTENMNGVQLTGAYSRISGEMRGLSIVLLGIGSVGGDANGAQFGLVNANGGDFSGFQSGIVLNITQGDYQGVQLASIFNLNAGETRFFQFSGVANVSERTVAGVQVSAFLNLAQDDANGLQLAAGNMAGDSKGMQVGVFNFASRAGGLQLGGINIASEQDGVPVGLVNLSERDGTIEGVAFGSNYSAANLGIRTTVRKFQSTLSAGFWDLEGDVENSAFLSWNYGMRFPLGRSWSLGADLGFTHVIPTEKLDDPAGRDRLHFALMARLLPEVRLSQKVGVFAGPGVATIFDEYSSHAASETVALFTAGVAVVP